MLDTRLQIVRSRVWTVVYISALFKAVNLGPSSLEPVFEKRCSNHMRNRCSALRIPFDIKDLLCPIVVDGLNLKADGFKTWVYYLLCAVFISIAINPSS